MGKSTRFWKSVLKNKKNQQSFIKRKRVLPEADKDAEFYIQHALGELSRECRSNLELIKMRNQKRSMDELISTKNGKDFPRAIENDGLPVDYGKRVLGSILDGSSQLIISGIHSNTVLESQIDSYKKVYALFKRAQNQGHSDMSKSTQ